MYARAEIKIMIYIMAILSVISIFFSFFHFENKEKEKELYLYQNIYNQTDDIAYKETIATAIQLKFKKINCYDKELDICQFLKKTRGY